MNGYTLFEVAKRIGINPSTLAHHHRIGALAEPQRFNRTRIYSDDDVTRIRDYFRKRKLRQRIEVPSE